VSRRYITQLVAAATLLCGRAVGAQYASPAGLHRAAAPAATQHVVLPSAVTVDKSRLRGAARGALIGTGVGAAVGIVVVAATPHSDHSEDAVAPVIGAFFGLFIGAAIGAAHPR
jgi:hypothetical protein